MIKDKIRNGIRKLLVLLHHHKYEKFYRHVMPLNGIANKPAKGEKDWLQKWSVGGGQN